LCRPAEEKKAIKQSVFKFRRADEGWEVQYRGRWIGSIVATKEANGRHCFRLGFDCRKEPRTYRGKFQAAEALKVIDELKRQAAKAKWDTDMLIVQSWDRKPQSVAV
jgi:hypothetical protein